MKLLAQTLKLGQIKTRRDIFYNDVDLFQSQRVVDNCIDTLCTSMDVAGYELGAVPSQKGLIHGNLKIIYPSEKEVNQSIDIAQGPTLIPFVFRGCKFVAENTLEYVLVVEKEAVFKTLLSSACGNRIIITGKGFPDHLTRSFVAQLREDLNEIPIYCLTDSDVYGLLIYFSYQEAMRTPWSNQSSILYLGVYLLDNTENCFDISSKDFNMMKHFISRCLSLEDTLGRTELSLKAVKKEAQRGIYILKKSEMNVVCENELVIGNQIEYYIKRRMKLL